MMQLVPTMVRCQNPKCKEITEIVDYKSIVEFSIILFFFKTRYKPHPVEDNRTHIV